MVYPPRYRVKPLPRLTEDELDWQARAECRKHDPDLWHPIKGGAAYSAAAVAICERHCPVLAKCRAYALSHREPHGIWGGLTEQERESIRQGIPWKSLSKKGFKL